MIKSLLFTINNHRHTRHLLPILAICTGILTITTYLYFTSSAEMAKNYLVYLIIVDLAMFALLMSTISKKLFNIWREGSKPNEAKLQKRIVLMFSLGTAVPTIIVAIFSFVLFNYGIQSWFNQKVSTAIDESVIVAEAYLKEHKENIKADALSMANDINLEVSNLVNNPGLINQFIESQVNARSLSEVIIFRRFDRQILARSRLSFSLFFIYDKLTDADFSNADKFQAIILDDEKNDRVRALVKLNSMYDTYLLVGRLIDSNVLSHTEASQGAAQEYSRLKSGIYAIQIQFSLIFLIAAMFLLIASIARGIVFATELTEPIKELLNATDLVRTGDLSARVPERIKKDEISTLGRAFNLMTKRLEDQRCELMEANKEIDAKRHFNEAVIAGVSAGIIAVDLDKRISVINKSASNILGVDSKKIFESYIVDICPEFGELLNAVDLKEDISAQSEISIMRNGRKIALLVRIVAEKFDNHLQGYIITFDDITELLVAQRIAAWSDVARRIAHEVKNPLTPILLAAERLAKKYTVEVTDQETFNKYISTIIRHANIIGGIIDEFVNFARIPSPSLSKTDLIKIINNAVFARQFGNNQISYKVNLQQQELLINIDESQIERILINILKNAEESIEQSANVGHGEISVTTELTDKFVMINIQDNGAGFLPEIINRLAEPYITTKTKGSGLGLAIVKKIIDDHAGVIEYSNNDEGGASVKIWLPR